MKNPYDSILEKYSNTPISYTDFCKILNISEKTKESKKKQLNFYRQYMDIETTYGKIKIKRLYYGDELLLNIKQSKFSEYFENLLILLLNEAPDNFVNLTYSDMAGHLYLINKNYKKFKHFSKREELINEYNLSISGNKQDIEKEEISATIRRHTGRFYTITDNMIKHIIVNALKSMQNKYLIMFNESYKLYKTIYNKELDVYITKSDDCNKDQVSEILNIQNRALEKYGLRSKQDIFKLNKETRENYFDYIKSEVKNSKLLNNSDFYGKIFLINLGKEGLKIEAEKINKEFNKNMINNNIQSKLLKSKELDRVNKLLREQLVNELIKIN